MKKLMNDLPRARQLRKQSTVAETAAWWLLRNRQVLGMEFRRQCPLGRFVVDFYCSEARLAIELDDGAHSQPSRVKKDRVRDRFLRSMGLRVLRLANSLVLEDPDGFRRKIWEAVRGGPEVELPVPASPSPLRLAKRRERATSPARGEG